MEKSIYMKRFIALTAAGMMLLTSCSGLEYLWVKDPIKISSPTPKEQITKVTLNETQTGYVEAGNKMAFRFLDAMFDGDNLICSPLSLQYALAMTANGASGETQQEIIDFINQAKSAGADIIVTTEKDAVRIPRIDRCDVPLYYLRIQIDILSGQENFDECISRICFM